MTHLKIPFVGIQRQYNDLRTEILEVTDDVLRSGQLMNGNYTAEFEHWLAKRNNSKYAVTCHSGTAALECIASYYADASKGMITPPRVIMPSLTYAATANAFMRAGWDIYFIDSDSHGLIDLRRIPDNLSYQAMVLVGLYGAAITHIGDTRYWRQAVLTDCTVIEDAAQHWLADDATRIGHAAAISFDPMKNLAANGNGGAIVTNHSELFHYARAWRDNGKADHVFVGTNNRMSELDCAHLLVKTRRIDAWQERRHTIARYWMDRLKDSPVRCLIDRDNIHDHSIHKFVIDHDDRDRVRENLRQRRIETRVHYAQPLHEIGVFRQFPGPDILSSASALSRRVLSLPIYPELTDLQVDYVIDQLLDSVNSSG